MSEIWTYVMVGLMFIASILGGLSTPTFLLLLGIKLAGFATYSWFVVFSPLILTVISVALLFTVFVWWE